MNQVVGGIVVAVVGVFLIGGLVAYAVLFKGKGGGAEASEDGKTPFLCTGNDSVRLKGVTATLTKGTAVSASGNCKLTLDDVKLSAPIGLEAAGNATVTFNGGSVDAKEAVEALGNANVTLKGT